MKTLLPICGLLLAAAFACVVIGCEHENVPAAGAAVPAPPAVAEKPQARTYDYSQKVLAGSDRRGGRKITVAILRFGDTREVQQSPFGEQTAASAPAAGQVAVNVQVGDNVNVGPSQAAPQMSKRSREELKHELVKSEFFTVVERERILEILREINFGKTKYVDEKTAPEEGQILAVRYLIEGSLGWNEDKGLKDNVDKGPSYKDDVAQPGFMENLFSPGKANREKMLAAMQQQQQARADAAKREMGRTACYLSVYDVSTGEIVASVMGLGSNNLEAIQDAVDELTDELSQRRNDIRVASVSDDKVYIDVGSSGGVENGARYQVTHLGQAIRDREGAVIGHEESEVGEIEVTEARDQLSICKVVHKAGEIARGDVVKPAKH